MVVKVLGFEVRVKIRLIRAAEDAIGGALKLGEKSLELEECDQRE